MLFSKRSAIVSALNGSVSCHSAGYLGKRLVRSSCGVPSLVGFVKFSNGLLLSRRRSPSEIRSLNSTRRDFHSTSNRSFDILSSSFRCFVNQRLLAEDRLLKSSLSDFATEANSSFHPSGFSKTNIFSSSLICHRCNALETLFAQAQYEWPV